MKKSSAKELLGLTEVKNYGEEGGKEEESYAHEKTSLPHPSQVQKQEEFLLSTEESLLEIIDFKMNEDNQEREKRTQVRRREKNLTWKGIPRAT